MLNENINMEHLIKRLEKSVAFAEKEGENMDDVSWGMQEGVLISYNEAKEVIESLKAFKISSNPVLVDSYPLHHCGNKLTDKEIFHDHCLKCGEQISG